MDVTLDDKHGELYILLLDWSKAFDRVKPDAMLLALRRFGIPNEILEFIRAIYRERSFAVKDGSNLSEKHPQYAGIAQGCPLPPYLFIIMMSLLMKEAASLSPREPDKPYLVTADLLYADDTMILGSKSKDVQSFFHSVAEVGQQYGLELNFDKTVLMRVGGADDIHDTQGNAVKTQESERGPFQWGRQKM